MEDELEEEEKVTGAEDFSSYLPYTYIPVPNPISIFWAFTKLLCFQLTQSITICISILLISPIFFLYSLIPRAKEADKSIESSAAGSAIRFPSARAAGKKVGILVKKALYGFVGALYAYMVVTAVMCLAIALGVGLVHAWVEEPVLVREKLAFDYTHLHPNAVFSLRRAGDHERTFVDPHGKNKKLGRGVPVGHTFYVSLFLLMPESEYNLQVGIFQLNAELTSSDGYVLAKSTKPCMLRFRSLPIRFIRRILMGIPLLLGITEETQKMTIQMLKHKEGIGYPRTEAIRISMIPRAGSTSFVPQLYEAEIIINSQPPWSKEIVRQWKWTFCVWTSIHIYIVLLIILVRFFKPLIIPVTRVPRTSPTKVGDEQHITTAEALKEPQVWERRTEEETEVSEALRRWKRSSSEGEAMLLCGASPYTVGSSASSTSNITREETLVASTTSEDEGDSESFNFGGSTE